MSTATTTPTTDRPRTIDISQDQRVPFSRLVSVETRKSFDTRSGRWLTFSIVGQCWARAGSRDDLRQRANGLAAYLRNRAVRTYHVLVSNANIVHGG